MNVAVLQRYLRDLSGFVQQAGGSAAVVKDLDAIQGGLAAFATYPLKDFAGFLQWAEEHHRNGTLPVTAKPPAPKSAKGKSAPKLPPEEVARRAVGLRDRITSPDVSAEEIDQVLAEIRKLTGPGLKTVAAALGVEEAVKPTKVKLDEKKRIVEQAVLAPRHTAERLKL
jgi:hypothetical protein